MDMYVLETHVKYYQKSVYQWMKWLNISYVSFKHFQFLRKMLNKINN